jgi:hypothetical protein
VPTHFKKVVVNSDSLPIQDAADDPAQNLLFERARG